MTNSKRFIDLGIPIFILFILLFTLSIFVSATDYCDPDLCAELGKNVVHTACNHTGKFHSRCLPPYYVIPISPSTKKLILHVHNDLRNKVANGTLPGFQSAVRMPTLLWDSELAYVVELHLKSCFYGHDECKNTDTFRYVGQNLGEELGDDIADNETESIVTKLTVQWFDEYVFAKQSDTDMCCDANHKDPIGHFTQLIHQQVVRVGCATTRYDKVYNGLKLNTLYYGCNYSFSNLIGAPIYDKGPAASGCTTGVNPEFNALCSVYEEVNQWPNFLDPQDIFVNKRIPIFSQFQPDSKVPTASRPAQTGNLMDALGKAKTIRRTKPMVKPWELTGADNETRNEPPKIPVTTQHQPKQIYKPSLATQPAQPHFNVPTSSARYAPVSKISVKPPEKKPSYPPTTKPLHYGNQNEFGPPRHRTQINIPGLGTQPSVPRTHPAVAPRLGVQPPETRKPPSRPFTKLLDELDDDDDDRPPPLPKSAMPKVYKVVGPRPMPPSMQPKPYSSNTQPYRSTKAFPYAYGNLNTISGRRQSQDRGSIMPPKRINPPTLMVPGPSSPSRVTGYRPANASPPTIHKRIDNLGVADIRSLPRPNAGNVDETMGMLPVGFHDDDPQDQTCRWKPSARK